MEFPKEEVYYLYLSSAHLTETAAEREREGMERENNINADGKMMRQMIMDNNSHNDDEDEGTVK